MPVITPQVPDGLIEVMKAFAKSVVKEKPENIYEFATVHFEKLIAERDGRPDKGYERFTSGEGYFRSHEKYDFSLCKYLIDDKSEKVCDNLGSASSRDKKRNKISAEIDIADKETSSQPPSLHRKLRPRRLSTQKPAEGLNAIKEEEDSQADDIFNSGGVAAEDTAARKIQRALRKYLDKTKAEKYECTSTPAAGLGRILTQDQAAIIIQKAFKCLFGKQLKEEAKFGPEVDSTESIDITGNESEGLNDTTDNNGIIDDISNKNDKYLEAKNNELDAKNDDVEEGGVEKSEKPAEINKMEAEPEVVQKYASAAGAINKPDGESNLDKDTEEDGFQGYENSDEEMSASDFEEENSVKAITGKNNSVDDVNESENTAKESTSDSDKSKSKVNDIEVESKSLSKLIALTKVNGLDPSQQNMDSGIERDVVQSDDIANGVGESQSTDDLEISGELDSDWDISKSAEDSKELLEDTNEVLVKVKESEKRGSLDSTDESLRDPYENDAGNIDSVEENQSPNEVLGKSEEDTRRPGFESEESVDDGIDSVAVNRGSLDNSDDESFGDTEKTAEAIQGSVDRLSEEKSTEDNQEKLEDIKKSTVTNDHEIFEDDNNETSEQDNFEQDTEPFDSLTSEIFEEGRSKDLDPEVKISVDSADELTNLDNLKKSDNSGQGENSLVNNQDIEDTTNKGNNSAKSSKNQIHDDNLKLLMPLEDGISDPKNFESDENIVQSASDSQRKSDAEKNPENTEQDSVIMDDSGGENFTQEYDGNQSLAELEPQINDNKQVQLEIAPRPETIENQEHNYSSGELDKLKTNENKVDDIVIPKRAPQLGSTPPVQEIALDRDTMDDDQNIQDIQENHVNSKDNNKSPFEDNDDSVQQENNQPDESVVGDGKDHPESFLEKSEDNVDSNKDNEAPETAIKEKSFDVPSEIEKTESAEDLTELIPRNDSQLSNEINDKGSIQENDKVMSESDYVDNKTINDRSLSEKINTGDQEGEIVSNSNDENLESDLEEDSILELPAKEVDLISTKINDLESVEEKVDPNLELEKDKIGSEEDSKNELENLKNIKQGGRNEFEENKQFEPQSENKDISVSKEPVDENTEYTDSGEGLTTPSDLESVDLQSASNSEFSDNDKKNRKKRSLEYLKESLEIDSEIEDELYNYDNLPEIDDDETNTFNDRISSNVPNFEDIEKPNVEKSNIEETNVEERNLDEPKLEEADLYEQKLEAAGLEEAYLKVPKLEETLEEADLKEPKLEGNLEATYLEESKLEEGDSEATDLEEPKLGKADLEEPKLEETDLEESNSKEVEDSELPLEATDLEEEPKLEGDSEATDLEEPKLGKADFEEPKLEETDFEESDSKEVEDSELPLEATDLEEEPKLEGDLEATYLEEPKLGKADLEEPKLEETDLEESNSKEVEDSELQLEATDLEEPKLKEADLGEPKLGEADFEERKLEETDLEGSNSKEVEDSELPLEEADLEEPKLKGGLEATDLEEPKLGEADLDEPKLEETDLEESNSKEVEDSELPLEEADLEEPKLKGGLEATDLEEPKLGEADLDEPKLEETDLEESNSKEVEDSELPLEEIDLEEPKLEVGLEATGLEEPKFEEGDLKATDLEEPKLGEADLEEPKLVETDQEESNSKEVEDSKLQLEEADLEEPKLEEPDLEESNSKEPKLDEPNLEEQILEEPDLKEPNFENSNVEESSNQKPNAEEPNIDDVSEENPKVEGQTFGDERESMNPAEANSQLDEDVSENAREPIVISSIFKALGANEDRESDIPDSSNILKDETVENREQEITEESLKNPIKEDEADNPEISKDSVNSESTQDLAEFHGGNQESSQDTVDDEIDEKLTNNGEKRPPKSKLEEPEQSEATAQSELREPDAESTAKDFEPAEQQDTESISASDAGCEDDNEESIQDENISDAKGNRFHDRLPADKKNSQTAEEQEDEKTNHSAEKDSPENKFKYEEPEMQQPPVDSQPRNKSNKESGPNKFGETIVENVEDSKSRLKSLASEEETETSANSKDESKKASSDIDLPLSDMNSANEKNVYDNEKTRQYLNDQSTVGEDETVPDGQDNNEDGGVVEAPPREVVEEEITAKTEHRLESSIPSRESDENVDEDSETKQFTSKEVNNPDKILENGLEETKNQSNESNINSSEILETSPPHTPIKQYPQTEKDFLSDAAVQIQKAFRGYMTRKLHYLRKGEIPVTSDNEIKRNAAMKIQTAFRKYQTRKNLGNENMDDLPKGEENAEEMEEGLDKKVDGSSGEEGLYVSKIGSSEEDDSVRNEEVNKDLERLSQEFPDKTDSSEEIGNRNEDLPMNENTKNESDEEFIKKSRDENTEFNKQAILPSEEDIFNSENKLACNSESKSDEDRESEENLPENQYNQSNDEDSKNLSDPDIESVNEKSPDEGGNDLSNNMDKSVNRSQSPVSEIIASEKPINENHDNSKNDDYLSDVRQPISERTGENVGAKKLSPLVSQENEQDRLSQIEREIIPGNSTDATPSPPVPLPKSDSSRNLTPNGNDETAPDTGDTNALSQSPEKTIHGSTDSDEITKKESIPTQRFLPTQPTAPEIHDIDDSIMEDEENKTANEKLDTEGINGKTQNNEPYSPEQVKEKVQEDGQGSNETDPDEENSQLLEKPLESPKENVNLGSGAELKEDETAESPKDAGNGTEGGEQEISESRKDRKLAGPTENCVKIGEGENKNVFSNQSSGDDADVVISEALDESPSASTVDIEGQDVKEESLNIQGEPSDVQEELSDTLKQQGINKSVDDKVVENISQDQSLSPNKISPEIQNLEGVPVKNSNDFDETEESLGNEVPPVQMPMNEDKSTPEQNEDIIDLPKNVDAKGVKDDVVVHPEISPVSEKANLPDDSRSTGNSDSTTENIRSNSSSEHTNAADKIVNVEGDSKSSDALLSTENSEIPLEDGAAEEPKEDSNESTDFREIPAQGPNKTAKAIAESDNPVENDDETTTPELAIEKRVTYDDSSDVNKEIGEDSPNKPEQGKASDEPSSAVKSYGSLKEENKENGDKPGEVSAEDSAEDSSGVKPKVAENLMEDAHGNKEESSLDEERGSCDKEAEELASVEGSNNSLDTASKKLLNDDETNVEATESPSNEEKIKPTRTLTDLSSMDKAEEKLVDSDSDKDNAAGDTEKKSDESEEIEEQEPSNEVHGIPPHERQRKKSVWYVGNEPIITSQSVDDISERPLSTIESSSEPDVGTTDADQDKAATQIQKTYRGYRTRKNLDAKPGMKLNTDKVDASKDDDVQEGPPDEKGLRVPSAVSAPFLKVTASSPDLKEEDAAEKIQKSYRGYRARRDLASEPNLAGQVKEAHPSVEFNDLEKEQDELQNAGDEVAPLPEEEPSVDSEDLKEVEAARQIQKTYRGYRVRRDLQAANIDEAPEVENVPEKADSLGISAENNLEGKDNSTENKTKDNLLKENAPKVTQEGSKDHSVEISPDNSSADVKPEDEIKGNLLKENEPKVTQEGSEDHLVEISPDDSSADVKPEDEIKDNLLKENEPKVTQEGSEDHLVEISPDDSSADVKPEDEMKDNLLKENEPKVTQEGSEDHLVEISPDDSSADVKPEDAALQIQKTYRGYRVRKELNKPNDEGRTSDPVHSENEQTPMLEDSVKDTPSDVHTLEETAAPGEVPSELNEELNSSNEEPNPTNDPDEDDAARKIQKTYRGYRVRRDLNGLDAIEADRDYSLDFEPETESVIDDIRQNKTIPEAVEKEAIKKTLQGTVESEAPLKVLQDSAENKGREESAENESREESAENEGPDDSAQKRGAEKFSESSVGNDVPQKPTEEELAAINIQKTYRGYRTRRDLNEKRGSVSSAVESENRANEDSGISSNLQSDTETIRTSTTPSQSVKISEEAAATQIQSVYRGYRARKDIKSDQNKDKTGATEDEEAEIFEEPFVQKKFSLANSENAFCESSDAETVRVHSRSTIRDDLSDIENMDLSVYGEDSLEAMYYSLRKNEILLDQMHRRASVHKSADTETQHPQAFDETRFEPIKNMDELQRKVSDEELVIRGIIRSESIKSIQSGPPTPIKSYPERHSFENPMDSAALKTHNFLKELHDRDGDEFDNEPSDVIDELTSDQIRQKILACSVSEADSDFYETAVEKTNAIDDFDISTALEATTSSDTDSTIISAATKIQAGARGFLTRRRLRRASMGAVSLSERQASFGNDAINESLEDLAENQTGISETDAAICIQKSYRYYRDRRNHSEPYIRDSTEETSSKDNSDEGILGITEIKLEQRFHVNEDQQKSGISHPANDTSDNSISAGSGNGSCEIGPDDSPTSTNDAGDEKIVGTGTPADGSLSDPHSTENSPNSERKHEHLTSMNLDELNLAQRRMTLQRGDAVQRNSTPEEENGAGPSTGGKIDAETGEFKTQNNSQTKEKTANARKLYRFGPRQRTMPVQIDCEILRVLPKHLRKRIRSADGQKKRRDVLF